MKPMNILPTNTSSISGPTCEGKAELFRQEADAFLSAMPDRLQESQAEAILQAVNGNVTALNAVRKSRNREPSLPDSVKATYVASRLRLYTPVPDSGRTLPLLVYLHGGGWTFGSIHSCARFCSELVATGKSIVLAVDYRLAPEYPFPHGFHDGMDAVEFALRHAYQWGSAPELVSVGGDSSGGNLALAIALHRIAQGLPPLRSLLLFYPVVSAWNDGSLSWQLYRTGTALDGRLMEVFNCAYAAGQERNPQVSVSLSSEDELAALPKMLLVAAERDILCSQGELFVRQLQRLGVSAHREVLPGSVHLFITVPGQENAFRHAVSLAEEFLCT